MKLVMFFFKTVFTVLIQSLFIYMGSLGGGWSLLYALLMGGSAILFFAAAGVYRSFSFALLALLSSYLAYKGYGVYAETFLPEDFILLGAMYIILWVIIRFFAMLLTKPKGAMQ